MIELIINIFIILLAFTIIWIIPGIIISAIIIVDYLFTHKSPIYIKDIKDELNEFDENKCRWVPVLNIGLLFILIIFGIIHFIKRFRIVKTINKKISEYKICINEFIDNIRIK